MIQVQTRNFGDIEITDERVLSFPYGLPGFPFLRHFTLVSDQTGKNSDEDSANDPGEDSDIFCWLQSMEDPDVSFCLMTLTKIMPEYAPLVEESDILILGQVKLEELLVYNIVVIPDNPRDMTVNMKAPVVINPQTRQGMQVICQNEDYAIRQPLFAQNPE